MADYADLLDIRRIVIEHELHHEVVVSRRLWIELEADEAKSLPLDEASWWISLEGARGILLDLVIGGRVAGVDELDGLIDRFVWSARGED